MFLLRTSNSAALFLIRLGLAAAILPHGLSKVGLLTAAGFDFGGFSFDTVRASAEGVASAAGFPDWMGYLAVAAELLGGIGLVVGFLGRFAALGIGATMVVAAWKVGIPLKGGDNWLVWWLDGGGAMTHGSFHILAAVVAFTILLFGSGAASLDRALSRPKGLD